MSKCAAEGPQLHASTSVDDASLYERAWLNGSARDHTNIPQEHTPVRHINTNGNQVTTADAKQKEMKIAYLLLPPLESSLCESPSTFLFLVCGLVLNAREHSRLLAWHKIQHTPSSSTNTHLTPRRLHASQGLLEKLFSGDARPEDSIPPMFPGKKSTVVDMGPWRCEENPGGLGAMAMGADLEKPDVIGMLGAGPM